MGLSWACIALCLCGFDGIWLWRTIISDVHLSLSIQNTMVKTATLWGIQTRHNLYLPSQMCCEIDMDKHLPVYKIWRLNGRNYGALTGLKKMDAVKGLGIDVVQAWWAWWMCLWMQLYNLHNIYSITVFLLYTQTCVIHLRHVHYPWIKMIPTIPWIIDSMKIYPRKKIPWLSHSIERGRILLVLVSWLHSCLCDNPDY